MNTFFLDRSMGLGPPNALARHFKHSQLHSITLAPTKFTSTTQSEAQYSRAESVSLPIAHHGGVNALAIDAFWGRHLLAGAASGSVSLYNLNDSSSTLEPIQTLLRGAPEAHKFGITHTSFYPPDPGAFLSSSFDTSLKLTNTETFVPAATFELDAPVYSHDMSPNGSHYLVACATQLSLIRLVDLRTSAAVHSLPGHVGAVLDVRWSPREEYILASAGADGSVRLWDVRRSSPQLGVLDSEDSIGVLGHDGRGGGSRPKNSGTAHAAVANGLAWSEDGQFLVSVGHDEKMRVWDTTVGANTLVNFGPALRNRQMSRMRPCLVPKTLVGLGKDVVFFPNDTDIMKFNLFEGTRLGRMRVPAATSGAFAYGSGRLANKASKVKDLAWRSFTFEMYSAHSDGTIHAWAPAVPDEKDLEQDEVTEEILRKRRALNDIYNDLTKRRATQSQ